MDKMAGTINLTPEESLMLSLSRLSFNDEQKARIRHKVKEGCNWELFVRLINDHGIIALVCTNLREMDLLGSIPPEQQNIMVNARLKSIARNTMLLEKYNRLKEFLEDIGIEPVLIKGMALELTIYGQQGLRQMNDLDILVERERVLEAWELLRSKGYQSVPPKSFLHKRFMVYIGKHLPELFMDGIAFELHHTLFDPTLSRISRSVTNNSKLVEDSTHRSLVAPPDSYHDCRDDNMVLQTEYDGLAYKILAPDIHFLYLVKHLHYHEQHGGAQVRQYLDLCQLMEQCTRNISETGIIEMAEKHGLRNQLLQKLYIMNRFWGFKLPEQLEASVSEEEKKEGTELFIKYLRKPQNEPLKFHEDEFIRTLGLIPGTWNKILYTIGDLAPSLTFMKFRYGTRTRIGALLYYPVRWLKSCSILLKKLLKG